jgi:hypothetical protein
VGIWVLPIIIFFLTRSACLALQRSEAHPLAEWQGTVVRRRLDGAVEVVAESPDRETEAATEDPVGVVPGHE